MLRRDRHLDPEVQEELDRLDDLLAAGVADRVAGGDAPAADDDGLALLVADVATTRPALTDAARERIEARMARALRAAAPASTAPPASTAADGDGAVPRPRAGGGADGGGSGPVVGDPFAVPTAPRPRRRARWFLAGGGVAATAIVAAVAISASHGGGSTEDTAVASSSTSTVAQGAAPSSAADSASTPAEPSLGRESSGPRTSEGGSSGSAVPASPAVPTTPTAPSGDGTTGGRQVVRDVSQTVRVDRGDVAGATRRVSLIVQQGGGYLSSSTVRSTGADPGATFQVVVPTGRLDETVGRLSRLGRLVRLDRDAQDVTEAVASLDDRLKDARAERDGLRRAVARTVDDDRRAARRRELRLASSRVASLEDQQRALRGRTAESRVSLELTTARASTGAATGSASSDDRWGIGDALGDAGRILGVAAGVAVLVLLVALPLVLALGLGGLGVRARRRATAARAIDGR